MKPLLSEAQRDRLELYCDEEGFVDRVESIALLADVLNQ